MCPSDKNFNFKMLFSRLHNLCTISVHLAFREATTGFCSALLKVFRDTG